MATFDVRLMPEFSGSDGDISVAEWYSKVTWICKLHKVTDLTLVIPLRLTGNAYRIYNQLSDGDKLDIATAKSVLFKAFEVDSFCAYERLHSRQLERGEPVDAYLADIKRLALLAGGLNEKAIGSAFVFGLPEEVRRTLRTNARMAEMDVTELLECARVILSDDKVASSAGVAVLPRRGRPVPTDQRSSSETGDVDSIPVCYACGQPGHYRRGCARRGSSISRPRRQIPTKERVRASSSCPGHRQRADCARAPGNGSGGKLASGSSPL